jgi:hypothetical protein
MSEPFSPSYFVCNLDQFTHRLKERAEYEANQQLITQTAQQRAEERETLRWSQLTPEERQQERDDRFKARLQKEFYGAIMWARSSGKYNHCHIWLDEFNTAHEMELARKFADQLKTQHGYQMAYVATDWEYDCVRNCVYIVDERLIASSNKRKVTTLEPIEEKSPVAEVDEDDVAENDSSKTKKTPVNTKRVSFKKARKM